MHTAAVTTTFHVQWRCWWMNFCWSRTTRHIMYVHSKQASQLVHPAPSPSPNDCVSARVITVKHELCDRLLHNCKITNQAKNFDKILGNQFVYTQIISTLHYYAVQITVSYRLVCAACTQKWIIYKTVDTSLTVEMRQLQVRYGATWRNSE